MSVGFIMLVHTELGRAQQIAAHWLRHGCPVVIHVDRKVKRSDYLAFTRALEGFEDVRFLQRHACEWGTFSLVAAMQAAAEIMLHEFPGVQHIYSASGSCLPLRPVAELRAYLAERPETDFIESVTCDDARWTVGGLDNERFTLRFPFAWRRQRWLFDRYVELQRRLGVSRRFPEGLEPHLGSQWWCLTRR
ncbi:MAG: glycosyl transferase, partial [Alphaproteobacteria bacterium HGW-Alphaproteobacteria-2]